MAFKLSVFVMHTIVALASLAFLLQLTWAHDEPEADSYPAAILSSWKQQIDSVDQISSEFLEDNQVEYKLNSREYSRLVKLAREALNDRNLVLSMLDDKQEETKKRSHSLLDKIKIKAGATESLRAKKSKSKVREEPPIIIKTRVLPCEDDEINNPMIAC